MLFPTVRRRPDRRLDAPLNRYSDHIIETGMKLS